MVGECSGRYGRAKLMPGTWRIGVRSAEGASGGRRARSCTEGSGGKSWNARRKGRLRLRPWLGSLQGRQSASYPVTPLSGCRDEAVLSSLVTRSAGLRLKRDRNCVRTARGTASLSLSLSLPLSLSLSLSVSAFVSLSLLARACVWCREINARVNVTATTELPCAGSPGFGQAPGTLPTTWDASVNEPHHRDDLDNFSWLVCCQVEKIV